MPPNYTPLQVANPHVSYSWEGRNREKTKYKILCKVHNIWEDIGGIKVGRDGTKQLSTVCGFLAPPPYISEYVKSPFAYTVKTYANQSFISFTVFSVLYKGTKKIKDELNFTISTVTGDMENTEKKFDVDNDKLSVPIEISNHIVTLMSKAFLNDFGFAPTLTSKVKDISVISGYVKYPFNANLAELQKVSGMQDFKIARDDSLNENKMFEFLGIKPTKALRKKYAEYPFAPIVWKFFERLGFKDVNIINTNIGNSLIHEFLIDHWVRYDSDEKRIVFNGDDQLVFFAEESHKRNGEKTVFGALLKCIKTEQKSGNHFFGYSSVYDSIDMIQGNFERMPDEIKKEIFHDGVNSQTHDNLVTLFKSMDMGLSESYKKMPFQYNNGELLLEYKEKNPKTNQTTLEFYLPKNEPELIEFGKKMHNCVGWGNYTRKVRERISTIVAVYVEGKANMCLELTPAKKIVQALGVCNKHLSKAQKSIIKDWASHRMVGLGCVE